MFKTITHSQTEYEFLLACLQLIKENATDGAADSMGTVKINVTQRKSRAGELMFGLLKYILQIQDMDQHVSDLIQSKYTRIFATQP